MKKKAKVAEQVTTPEPIQIDILTNTIFRKAVEKAVDEIRENRLKREAPKPGFYYKRDWYDRIVELGGMNADFFITNAGAVWEKKSNLPSNIRSVIQFVAEQALRETIQTLKPTPTKP